jgi:hypothetical protein
VDEEGEMSEIQRWSPSNEGTFEYSDGRYVLYTDHLAAMKEKDMQELEDVILIKRQVEQIAALQDRIKELEAVVASLQMLTEPKQH